MRPEPSGGQVALRLLLVLLAGALVRGLYLAWPYLDSDIAVVGLMARHALGGELTPPVLGQPLRRQPGVAHRGGGLCPGRGHPPAPSTPPPPLISLSYLPLLYLLGRELISRRAGLAAALLSALGPYMLVAYSVVARGLHVEMLPLGALLLWLTVRLLKAGPLAPGQAGPLLAWGLVAGVGVWTNPLFVYFLPPTMLLLIYRAPRLPLSWRFWGLALAALAGAAPLIYHNWLTGGGTLHYMEMPRPHSGFWANLHFLLREGLPAAVGAAWFRKDWVLPWPGPGPGRGGRAGGPVGRHALGGGPVAADHALGRGRRRRDPAAHLFMHCLRVLRGGRGGLGLLPLSAGPVPHLAPGRGPGPGRVSPKRAARRPSWAGCCWSWWRA